MAGIRLNALEELDIVAYREPDEDGDVMLQITADDGDVIQIRVGRTADDADRLATELNRAGHETGEIYRNWEDRPDRMDGFVSLDSQGRWFVTYRQKSPDDQPDHGYPRFEIAVYELARMIAGTGYFPAVWAEGEHGPSTNPAGQYVYAHINEQDQLRPLPGVKYEDGDLVSVTDENWPTWVIVRDYGELGVVVHTRGDESIWALTEHDLLTPIPADEG